MHACGLAGRADARGARDVVLEDHLGGLGWHAGLEVQLNGLLRVALLLLQLSCLVLLLRRQQPLQILVLELKHVPMVLLLSQADGLHVLVELLVHGHRLFNLVLLQVNSFSSAKLLLEDGHLGLHGVVVEAPGLLVVLHDTVHLVEVPRLGYITQHGVAPLSHWQTELLRCHVGQLPPHGLGLRGQGQLLQDVHSVRELAPVQAGPKIDQRFVQLVLHGVDPLVHNHEGTPVGPFDLLDIALDLVHRHPVGGFDGIPYTKLLPALGDDNVGARYPLHIVAVIEQCSAALGGNIVEVQLSPLVPEQQLLRPRVQLEPVHPRVVADCPHIGVVQHVTDTHGLQVEQVSHALDVSVRPSRSGDRVGDSD
mmetsp:Transcript_11151/g.25135  ORF Transcript_11151/g.25135 Transcript_11151/m.25135 type:complete len:366 (+) Transcript_11151:2945-4042(+)